MSRNKFFLHILAADKPFYEGECVSLVVPTLQGQYGIMAHHSNYISAVVPGELDFTVEEDGKEKRIRAAVSEGIVKVEKKRSSRARRYGGKSRRDRREQGAARRRRGKGRYAPQTEREGILCGTGEACPRDEQTQSQKTQFGNGALSGFCSACDGRSFFVLFARKALA